MIDSLARNYKLPVENIVSSIQVTEERPVHRTELHSPVNHGVKSDTLVNVVDLTDVMPKKPISRKDMTKTIKENFADNLLEETADKEAIITLPNNSRQIRHVVASKIFEKLNLKRNKNWKRVHQAGLSKLDELTKNSMPIMIATTIKQ